ncbi:MAG: hypothetical protein HRT44_13730 [Bdellovibrionales bacterium]|nr:hypothetical protein [Bdellovibrionales bacterium]
MRKTFCIIFIMSSSMNVYADEASDFGGIRNIKSGNTELSLLGDISYDSFSGLTMDLDFYGRYFFWDNFSLGLKYGRYNGTYHHERRYGLSMNWYFYEVGQWAFSYSQDIYRSQVDGFWGAFDEIRGSSRLGANYFINKNLSLNLGFEHDYSLENFDNISPINFTPKVGITVNF